MPRMIPVSPPEPQDVPDAEPILMVDHYSGHGGSFIFDSTTGQRTLVHQTLPATTN